MSYTEHSPDDIRIYDRQVSSDGTTIRYASVRLRKGWFETPSPYRVERLAFCQKHGCTFWLDTLMNVILSDADEMLWKVSRP